MYLVAFSSSLQYKMKLATPRENRKLSFETTIFPAMIQLPNLVYITQRLYSLFSLCWACLISINKVVNKHQFVIKHYDKWVTECCTNSFFKATMNHVLFFVQFRHSRNSSSEFRQPLINLYALSCSCLTSSSAFADCVENALTALRRYKKKETRVAMKWFLRVFLKRITYIWSVTFDKQTCRLQLAHYELKLVRSVQT